MEDVESKTKKGEALRITIGDFGLADVVFSLSQKRLPLTTWKPGAKPDIQRSVKKNQQRQSGGSEKWKRVEINLRRVCRDGQDRQRRRNNKAMPVSNVVVSFFANCQSVGDALSSISPGEFLGRGRMPGTHTRDCPPGAWHDSFQ